MWSCRCASRARWIRTRARATNTHVRRFLVVGVLLAACERDQCDGAGRCVDNVAINCVEIPDGEIGSHRERQDTDCVAQFCRTPPASVEGEAFCALDEAPDPDAPSMPDGTSEVSGCRDRMLVVWQHGYRVAENDCGRGWVCVDERSGLAPPCSHEAFCALDDAPDPRCAPGIGTTCVDDETLLYCECGFARSESLCSDPLHCELEEPNADVPEQGVCR